MLPPFPWFDVLIILALVALNGIFAMSELAIVSVRKARLEAMARAGRRGAAAAIKLASDPGKFLSTVQIGITLIGILAGAYSGASLGTPTAARLEAFGLSHQTAESVGFALVIGLTTYASLIIGELVPKQIALRAPEAIASVVALPMTYIATATKPLGWLLDQSSALIFKLLRLNRENEDQVTAEELHLIVAEAGRRLAPARHQRLGKVFGRVDLAHPLAAAAGHRLDQHGIADRLGLRRQSFRRLVLAEIAGGGGHARRLHQRLGRVLQAHGGNRLRVRPDPDQAGVDHGLRECRIFGQEAVTGVDRLRAGGQGGGDDPVTAQIGFAHRAGTDRDSGIGHADMQRIGIGIRMDGDGADAHRARGADDAAGDLAAIGDQETRHHRIRTPA